MFINTNVASLNAQRQLTKSTNSLGRSFQRLSSGLRINSAKDDAAGLAISTRFTSQIRGLNQALRNANDGISLAQTVEGALDESTNILQRIRELAIQSANDTNNSTDRASIDAEVQQLVEELDRIGTNTTFNNQNVLDGSFLQSFFQVGANARETIGVAIRDARATALGRAALSTTGAVSSVALADNEIAINGISIRGTEVSDDTVSTTLNTSSAIAKASAINDSTAFTGVAARVLESTVTGAGGITGGTLDQASTITLNGQVITGFTVEANDADDSLLRAINDVSAQTGVLASRDQNREIVLTAQDGRNIELELTGNAANITGLTSGVTTGAIELTSDSQYDVTGTVGRIGFATTQIIGVSQSDTVATVDVLTRESSNRTIDIIDRALNQVSFDRGQLGAIQSRFEATISNLATISENLSASRSRIRDADFASETAELTRNQIIQQAGTSVLATANQAPQAALSLLG
jgi:flagellin